MADSGHSASVCKAVIMSPFQPNWIGGPQSSSGTNRVEGSPGLKGVAPSKTATLQGSPGHPHSDQPEKNVQVPTTRRVG